MSGKGIARFMVGAVVAAVALSPRLALAIPAFSQQTGQPCSTCHIGGYGPQLTEFGRAFKLGGYTQTGGGDSLPLPLSAMMLASYSNTDKGQGAPVTPDFGDNGNFAVDQISVFAGGHIGKYFGGLVQGTFSGIDSTFHLDNTDIRLTKPFSVGNSDLQVGLDVNNAPTVQDPYNSTYAWGYPYVFSALVPTPSAQPLLAGALAGNSLGATVYAWYNRSLYLEAGVYNTYGPWMLSWTGTSYGPGSTRNPAPYLRAAYEWNWDGQSAHVGGTFMHSNFNPTISNFSTDGSNGHDSYTDYAIDGGYQFLGDGTNVVSVLGIYNHERQDLRGTAAVGGAAAPGHSLDQIRVNVAYWYQQTYGVTVGWQKSWGTADPVLYAPAALSGSASGKPDSNAFTLEADWVPFGKMDSWGSPWVNLKLGAQYTMYTQFNGGTTNYDGFGRNASDNNTLYVFAWLIF